MKKEYLKPENCPTLEAPKLNTMLWDQLWGFAINAYVCFVGAVVSPPLVREGLYMKSYTQCCCPVFAKCICSVQFRKKEEKYVGLTATDFKERYANHKASFKARAKSNSTELSKYIWQLKNSNTDYTISWKILCHALHYTNVMNRCNLCIAKKYYIICQPQTATLNK